MCGKPQPSWLASVTKFTLRSARMGEPQPQSANSGGTQVDLVQARPTMIYLKLFDNCNLRCNMCDCWQVKAPLPPKSKAHQVLEAVLEARPRAIRFTGGEPLLFPALGELIRRTSSSDVRALVITNGRILDRRIDELSEAGLDELIISIDGPQDVHDQIRGYTSLSGIRKGLASAPQAMELGINTVVQELNVRHLRETFDLIMSLPKVPSWWHLIPVRGQLEPSPGVADAEVEAVISLADRHGLRVIASVPAFTNDLTPCSVPQYAAMINATTGEVFGCNMLAYGDPPIGNVHLDSLKSILRGRRSQQLRDRCAAGTHETCRRCDPASRNMNQFFRERFN